jgi:hypothetical protein
VLSWIHSILPWRRMASVRPFQAVADNSVYALNAGGRERVGKLIRNGFHLFASTFASWQPEPLAPPCIRHRVAPLPPLAGRGGQRGAGPLFIVAPLLTKMLALQKLPPVIGWTAAPEKLASSRSFSF